MGIGIILKGLKNKFNELMGRDKKKDDNKKSSESLASKEEKRFDDTSPTKSKKTTASTDLDNTKNGASSGSVNSGEVHVEGLGQTTPAENTAPSAKQPSAGSRPPMPLPPSAGSRPPMPLPPSAGSRPPMPLPPSNVATNQPELPPPPRGRGDFVAMRYAEPYTVLVRDIIKVNPTVLSNFEKDAKNNNKESLNKVKGYDKLKKQIMYRSLELMKYVDENRAHTEEIEGFRKQINEMNEIPDTEFEKLRDKILSEVKKIASENKSTQQEPVTEEQEADPKDFEEELKLIIDKANKGCLFYDKYAYDDKEREDADVTIDDYTRQIYKISMNARNFLTKISEEIYGVEESVKATKVSIGIFYAHVMKYNWGRTEKKQKEVIDEIKKVVEDANKKADSLESKKMEIIDKESSRFDALVEKYKDITGKEYEIKKDNMHNFYESISYFWLYSVKKELEITDSNRADKLNSVMINIDKKILKNDDKLDKIPDGERLVSLEEALDQKFNIIGRVVLYLEKRKNKENEKDKEKGFFGKLFGKSKKSDKEDKKQKKEKLNNQKRLKKCFEDMGKYFVKNKDAVSATGLRKLVKNNDIDTYIEWNNGLRILLARNSISFNKELLMSALFISFIDLGDKESVIAACDGLKAGGIKSINPKSFEGQATSIRKAIKGKCATLDMAKDKDDLKNYIKTLCAKYFGLDMSTLTNIFGN